MKESRKSLHSILCATSLLALSVGCSGGKDQWVEGREPVYPVSGRITLKGQPVEGAVVIFHSKTKELSAQGLTDADGRYHLTTYDDGDGAVAGEHVVTVRKTEYVKKPTKFHTEEEPSYASIAQELLDKNAASPETSNLTANVTGEGTPDVNFDF